MNQREIDDVGYNQMLCFYEFSISIFEINTISTKIGLQLKEKYFNKATFAHLSNSLIIFNFNFICVYFIWITMNYEVIPNLNKNFIYEEKIVRV